MARLWTEEEVDLLHACMLRGYGPTQTSNEFTAKGYSRTVKAIGKKKAKEISIGENNWKMPIVIESKTVSYPEVKEESIFDWLLITCLTIGAIIITWWYIG